MSQIPDFTKLAFADVAAAPSGAAAPWQTPESIAVKGNYSAADLDGVEALDSYPGIAPYLQIGRAHV